MPLPDPCAGWPAFNVTLDDWGAELLRALAPIALTTWHDGDPTRKRFVGQPSVAAELDAAGTSSSDVGVSLSPTGNLLATSPTLGAQLRWIRRGGAPGIAGLSVRGEIGLSDQLAPPPSGGTQVLAFELLSDPGATQPEQITLGTEVTVRSQETSIELNLTVIDAPGPVRVRVGLVSGTPIAASARAAPGGGLRQTGFLDDGGTPSVIGAAGIDGLGVELHVQPVGGGAIPLISQLKVQIDLPNDPTTTGPQITVTGGSGMELTAQLVVRDGTDTVDATVELAGLPERLRVDMTPQGTATQVAWSTGTAAQPRSARLPLLALNLIAQSAGVDPVTAVARLEDVPPGVDLELDTAGGAVSVRGVTAAGQPSAIAVAHAELLTGFQAPPGLTDFIWLDLPAASAAAEIRDLHTVEVGFASGAPITAALGFAAAHPLSGFLTAPAVRGNATIEDVPTDVSVTADLAAGTVAWTANAAIERVALDVTLVTTDEVTGDGTGIIRVAGEIEDVPAGLDVGFAADRVALTFSPQAPADVSATVQLAEPGSWLPGEPPPALPLFDRTVEVEVEGLPDELELRVLPDFAALTTGAELRWRASGELAYAVAQLDGFALGDATPIRSLRARLGEVAPSLNAEYTLAPLRVELDVNDGDRIGAIHVLAGSQPVGPDGAAPRRLDADLDLRGGEIELAATVRGLQDVEADLPIGGGPNALDVRLSLGAPGAFPGGFTAQGPQLRGWLRTDELDAHVDARSINDNLRLEVDLDTFAVDARLGMTELDVDASGQLELFGTSYDFVADLRVPVLPGRIQVEPSYNGAGEMITLHYEATTAIDDVIAQLEATPPPLAGMQHARAELTVPQELTVDLQEPSLELTGSLEGKLRVRANREVPLPTTRRTGQVVRLITVPTAPHPDSIALGPFGFLEAAVGRIEAFGGFVSRAPGGAGGGTQALRGPRLLLTGAGTSQRIFASVQRRLAPGRLLRLAQAQLDIIRPGQIDLLTTPGPLGEVGVRFPGPLRPVGGAATLGSFSLRTEPPYAPVPGGPPTGERDPSFVVAGLALAGISDVSGTIAAVPAHVEFALTTLGPFGTTPTPLTISNPFNTTTLGIPSGWGGMRVDLILNGVLAVRGLSATLYSLDWRRMQRWQRISASRLDIIPSGRDDTGISPDRTITLHQFGLDPTVANGGSGGLGIALSVPTTAPLNIAAVISTAEFARSTNPTVAPSRPAGFGSPTQVDIGRLSGFLGLRVDPIPILNTPLIPVERDATNDPPTEWRIVATTPIAPVFLGNTSPVPLSVLAQIGLGIAAALIGGLVAGPWGAVAGIGIVVFESQYFTALEAPRLPALPSATT